MSKEYETELEKTIEHLHKVVEEKTKLIDQQRVMIDKFITGEISVNQPAEYLNGYVPVQASYTTSTTGPATVTTGYAQIIPNSDHDDIL